MSKISFVLDAFTIIYFNLVTRPVSTCKRRIKSDTMVLVVSMYGVWRVHILIAVVELPRVKNPLEP